MDTSQIIPTILEGILQLAFMFWVVWAISVVTVVIGIALIVTAFALKKNPARKKSPWIVGGIGLLLVISSVAQLIMGLFGKVLSN